MYAKGCPRDDHLARLLSESAARGLAPGAVACPRLREFSPQSINILWNHLPPDQEAVKMLANPILRESIDSIVYVSAWQKSETLEKSARGEGGRPQRICSAAGAGQRARSS